MPEFYLEFKTWDEGPIETPWPVTLLRQTNEYKSRSELSGKSLSDKLVQNVFSTFNENIYNKFLTDHVSAVVLGAVIENCHSKDLAINQLSKTFSSFELINICEINEENLVAITNIMQYAIAPKLLDS